MSEPQPILKEDLFKRLPPVWPDDILRQQIAQNNARMRRCVVVLDDDPTGTQTVHDLWVLTRWEVSDLRSALADGESALYILTNSRSMSLAEAQRVTREIAVNLVQAAKAENRQIVAVSRSDSTLRGHFPGEIEALGEALAQAQDVVFDGVCLIPFFPEGGRYTLEDIHWVQEGERLIPAAQTPYAQDTVFGYRHSRLPDWVEEKSKGKIKADQVQAISLDTLRRQGPSGVAHQLHQVHNGGIVVVNSTDYRDLEVFVAGLHRVEEVGKHFLFRTAASFVKVAAGLSDKDLLSPEELTGRRSQASGLIVFGSYVPKSTAQLAALKSLPGIQAIELPVAQVLDKATRQESIRLAVLAADLALDRGDDALVYTSREFYGGDTQIDSLTVGKSISAALIQVVRGINHEPRFVIGKGGITSSDLATQGMDVRAARVLGQVLPGVPVWKLGPGSRWAGVPFVVFPGNVGDDQAVARVVQILRTSIE